MQRNGTVEDARSIDGLNTSGFITGRPILDFENLDIKIASELGKIHTRNFKKQACTYKIYRTFNLGTTMFLAFETLWDWVSSAVTDRPPCG